MNEILKNKVKRALQRFENHNIDPWWRLDRLRDVNIISGENDRDNRQEIERLKANAQIAGRPLEIIPINSWYRYGGDAGPIRKKILTEPARYFSHKYNLPIRESIIRAGYTCNSTSGLKFGAKEQGYFVGHIPRGTHVLLLDDFFDTGTTARDAAKFATGCGAAVVGLLTKDGERDNFYHTRRGAMEDTYYSHFYGSLNGITDAKTAEIAFSRGKKDSERAEFKWRFDKIADPHLTQVGLSMGQLFGDQMLKLASVVFDSLHAKIIPLSEKDLAEKIAAMTEKVPPHLIPKAKTIIRPEEFLEFITLTLHAPNNFYTPSPMDRTKA